MNSYLLIARFKTAAHATEIATALGTMYAEHRALVTSSGYRGPELRDQFKVQASPPMRAVAKAHGFEWPADDGISVEPDSEDAFVVKHLGSLLVVYHPYALQIGEAGITALAKSNGADLVIGRDAGELHVRAFADDPSVRADLTSRADPDVLPERARRFDARPIERCMTLELPDATRGSSFIVFESTTDLFEWILEIGRIRGAELTIEPAPQREELCVVTLRDVASRALRDITVERVDHSRFAVVMRGGDEYSVSAFASLRQASAECRRLVLACNAQGIVVVFDQDEIDRANAALYMEAYKEQQPPAILERIPLRAGAPRPFTAEIPLAPSALRDLASNEARPELRMALTAPLSEEEQRHIVDRHAEWLEHHRDLPHIWVAMRTGPSGIEFAMSVVNGSSQASFSRRDLRGRSFAGMDLTAAQLIDAIADDVDFRGASLSNAFAIGMRARGAVFDAADLSRVDISRADLTNASFKGADCRGADFEDCILTGADFTGSDLRGAVNFRGPIPSTAVMDPPEPGGGAVPHEPTSNVERYEAFAGGASSFWEVEIVPRPGRTEVSLVIRFGRIGTSGRSSVKLCDDDASARAARDKLVKEKLAKGYRRAKTQ